ncbi:unnamed protein product [Mytilus coruscus]|uniref:Uncharacterized protein n=1 Tax=Mytilus coruscus TaxID=42192 RepID=A0A6J7ZRI7_MYTCO|nr:unnamed protein product [Mytilus coruscus]
MSDRVQTNIAFNDLLEQYRLDIMPNFISNWNELSNAERSMTSKVNNFFCGLHLLVNFAECLSPILKLFEKMQETESSLQDNFSGEDEAPEIQVFSTDSKTISFLRFCGKCFGRGVDEKKRMSKDANPFVSGEEYPFSDDLMEKDNIFDNLIQPVNCNDETACAFAQMAFKGLHGVLERAMKEQLPGGKFFEPTQESIEICYST